MEVLNEEFIKNISVKKGEPKWMCDFRLLAYHKFLELDNPNFGPTLKIDFNKIKYYKGSFNPPSCKWDDVDDKPKQIFKALGVIDAENKYLDGVANQYESEVLYHRTSNDKIVFLSTDEALKK